MKFIILPNLQNTMSSRVKGDYSSVCEFVFENQTGGFRISGRMRYGGDQKKIHKGI